MDMLEIKQALEKCKISTLLKKIKGTLNHQSIPQSQLNLWDIDLSRKRKRLWINFTCFGANESDNRWTGEATARQPPKRKWFCILHCICSLSFLTDFSLVLHFASADVTTGSMRRYLQPIQAAQVVQLLQDGTSMRQEDLCPSRSQERGGDGKRRAITQGELEGQQPSSRTGISFCEWGGTGGTLPEPYKRTSFAGYLCACFWPNCQETGSMRVAWGHDVLSWDPCSQPSTVQLDWHLPENTRIGRFTIGAPFSSQLRAGSQFPACDRCERVWRCRGECYAACNIIQHDGGSVMVWGGISLAARQKPPRASQRYPDCC